MILRSSLWVIGAIAALVTMILLTAALTGHERRAYRSLRPNDIIEVNHKLWNVADLAAEYRPLMHLRESTPSPDLLWVWYEAVARNDMVDLIYYFNWESEINPVKSVNSLYAVFRAAYFGYPLYDIEYFQVGVDSATGRISRVRFETSASDEYYQTVPTHLTVILNSEHTGRFEEIRTDKKGTVSHRRQAVTPLAEQNKLSVGVQTWNHLSVLLDEQHAAMGFKRLPDNAAPLRYLTDLDYKRYKFARKSQGDHRTRQSPLGALAGLLAIAIFVTVPMWLGRRVRNRVRPDARR